jgi:hypothetical protein
MTYIITSATGVPPGPSTTISSPIAIYTSTSVINVPTAGALALDCPNLDGSTESITFSSKTWDFGIHCGVGYYGNIDLPVVISYTLRDCMQACVSWNSHHNADICVAVAFVASLNDIGIYGGSCWLKNSTGSISKGTVGATLIMSK